MVAKLSGKKSGISAGTLKMIAMVTMLIDHIAATIMVRYFYTTNDWELMTVYQVMRQIGRIAFPIYCFLLIEGLRRTRSKGKYLARMAAFALLSEIPFDLAFSSEILEFEYQNVFFTLSVALVSMIGMEWASKKVRYAWMQIIVNALIAVGGIGLAEIMRTDYGGYGVACIFIMYFLRNRPKAILIAGYLAFVFLLGELAALPAFILLAFYRGRKGFSGKALFYGFYPAHLLILYFVCVILGIASVSAI